MVWSCFEKIIHDVKEVKEDVLDIEITNDLWENHIAWGDKVHVADPNYIRNVNGQ